MCALSATAHSFRMIVRANFNQPTISRIRIPRNLPPPRSLLQKLSREMDIHPVKSVSDLGLKKQHVSKDYFHLTERTRKQAEVKACRESFKTCPHYLWMDVLRTFDVRTYRRLARVSRGWQSSLQEVPRHNKGIFYLEFSTKFQFLQFKKFFPNGHHCFELLHRYYDLPELLFSPEMSRFGYHSINCQFHNSQAQDVGRKQRRPFDYEWWGKVFGVPNLGVVKKVHYRTSTFGAQPLKIWLGIEPSNYAHTLWRARKKQMELCRSTVKERTVH